MKYGSTKTSGGLSELDPLEWRALDLSRNVGPATAQSTPMSGRRPLVDPDKAHLHLLNAKCSKKNGRSHWRLFFALYTFIICVNPVVALNSAPGLIKSLPESDGREINVIPWINPREAFIKYLKKVENRLFMGTTI